METSEEVFKQFILKLTTSLRDLEFDLLAHQAVLAELHPDLEDQFRRIDAAKHHPKVRKMIQDKYDIPLAKFREVSEQLGVWKAAAAMLQEVQKTPKSN